MVDPLALFDETALICGKIFTNQYSDSFTIAVESLEEKFRLPLYALYAFSRIADETVDTFHHKDQRSLFNKLKEETFEAIDAGISLNPLLHGFQLVVNKYKIDLKLVDTFLHSMEMDLYIKSYDEAQFKEYVAGSSEAIMLIFLYVLCDGDSAAYESASEPAAKLTVAFQKLNDLRDLSSDYRDRGRVYFSGLDIKCFNKDAKKLIEDDIEKDFKNFAPRIEQLSAAPMKFLKIWYAFYSKLFNRIKASTPEKVLKERIRISQLEKLCIRFMYRPNNYLCMGLILLMISCILGFYLVFGFSNPSKWYSLFPAILVSVILMWITRAGM